MRPVRGSRTYPRRTAHRGWRTACARPRTGSQLGVTTAFSCGFWQPPRRARTILGMAAAVFFLGLATAYLSPSTTVVDPNFSSELPTVAQEPGSGHQR